MELRPARDRRTWQSGDEGDIGERRFGFGEQVWQDDGPDGSMSVESSQAEQRLAISVFKTVPLVILGERRYATALLY